MTDAQKLALKNSAIALAILYGIYRFAPYAQVKAMALGVGGVIVAKQIPYVNTAV